MFGAQVEDERLATGAREATVAEEADELQTETSTKTSEHKNNYVSRVLYPKTRLFNINSRVYAPFSYLFVLRQLCCKLYLITITGLVLS